MSSITSVPSFVILGIWIIPILRLKSAISLEMASIYVIDPTTALITLDDASFGPRRTQPDLPMSYHEPTTTAVVLVPSMDGSGSNSPLVSSPSAYTHLLETKRHIGDYAPDKFDRARRTANPAERIDSSIFMNRAGLKLANIDALYKITRHLGGLASLTTSGTFKFCDLAGAPGAFAQYIQWRRPDAIGYGISLKSLTPGVPDWNLDRLDMQRFFPFYGDSGTGDLYVESRSFIDRVLADQGIGVDAVVADGGFDVETQYDQQEPLSYHLITVEVATALHVLRPGGDMVVKVFDTVTPGMAQLIYICACCFDQVTLVKPMTSRPANSEKYLIGKGRRDNIKPWLDVLDQATVAMNNTTILSLTRTPLPPRFISWLIGCNDAVIAHQQSGVDRIFDVLDRRSVVPIKLDLHRASLVLNLPTRPPPPGLFN